MLVGIKRQKNSACAHELLAAYDVHTMVNHQIALRKESSRKPLTVRRRSLLSRESYQIRTQPLPVTTKLRPRHLPLMQIMKPITGAQSRLALMSPKR